MSWNKNASGGGDSGAELTMPSDEEGRSFPSSRSPSQPRPLTSLNLPKTVEPPLGSARPELPLNSSRTEPPLSSGRPEPPLKEPWVPAPGKTSKIRSRSFSSMTAAGSHYQQHASSSCENTQANSGKSLMSILSGKESVPKVKYKRRSRSNRSRSIDDRKMSGYTLQSKDSLIDVTACLNKRRDEVFKLWEKNVLNCDSTLLGELENANMLAIEAANDVNDLRKTIDALKKKSGKLSPEDSKTLDVLRNRILTKLELFETSHDHIQKSLRASRESSRNHRSKESKRPIAETNLDPTLDPKMSQESIHSKSSGKVKVKVPSEPSSSLIYLKTIAESFSEGDTENEIDYDDFEESDLEKLKVNKSKSRNSSKCRMKRKDRTGTFDGMNSTMLVDTIYYRDKIRGLHKKLMDQEAKCTDMKREMKRIESQNEYDIKLLKSNMKAQMEDMGHLPEMLEFTEDRLNESLHAKFAIESTLQLKISEINAMKIESSRLGKDLESAETKLKNCESKNESMAEKLERLETENKELRMEVWSKSQQLAEINSNSPTKETKTEKRDHKFLLLEDKIAELESELEAANKETVAMRRAKHDISAQLNRRIDELMDTLDSSRAKNRSLQSQINLIKTKYYQIFVPQGDSAHNIFPEMSKVIAKVKHELGGATGVNPIVNDNQI